jgi:hypothetical protein
MDVKPQITSIRYYYGPVRKKPKEGDIKTLKDGRKFIRKQAFTSGPFGGYQVRNGRPVYEWVEIKEKS